MNYMNEEAKELLKRSSDICSAEPSVAIEKLIDLVESILYLLDDEMTERKNLESKIEGMRHRVDGLDYSSRRC